MQTDIKVRILNVVSRHTSAIVWKGKLKGNPQEFLTLTKHRTTDRG